jgi:Xaa-Pro aminopeptidase
MNASFFQMNRDKIATATAGDFIVLSAYCQMQRGNDASFAFEQEANFWYLTGIESPDWWVIIDGKTNKSYLIAPEVDDVHQTFDGSLSHADAKKISGVDSIFTYVEGRDFIKKLSQTHSSVYTIGPDPRASSYDFVVNPAAKDMNKLLKKQFTDVRDCRHELSKLRAIKQPVEISAIKQAIRLTNDTFKKVKLELADFHFEYEIEAAFSYEFRKNGAKGHAYDPIIAAEGNACTLHYNDNADQLEKDTLILMDVGARVGGYAADVTRTYAYGTPTERQILVHRAVKNAHKQIIELLRPGLSIVEYQKSVDDIMQHALIGLGLMTSLDDITNYRNYFPHAISHGLGIDVHDSL